MNYKRNWRLLLFDYLKEAGDKGLTMDEIEALFPSKTTGSIQSVLYRSKCPRKPYISKKTGKCRKIYFYPKNQWTNWKKRVKKLLTETEHGLSLTDILMETGVPKAQVSKYLDALKVSPIALKSIKLLKFNNKRQSVYGPRHIIERYYIGETVKIRKDEMPLSVYEKRVQNHKNFTKDRRTKIVEVMHSLLKKQKRFTIKEVENFFLDKKYSASEFLIRQVAKEEGFKSIKVYRIGDQRKNRSYIVYYMEKVPLLDNEVSIHTLPYIVEKLIIESLNKGNTLKVDIKKYVGRKLGYSVDEDDSPWGSKFSHPALFQRVFYKLREDNKVIMNRRAQYGATYRLGSA